MLPAEYHREMARKGLRSRFGKELAVGGFIWMLRNPVYCGKISSKKYGTQLGIHQPCASEAVFNRVQKILRGEKLAAGAYERNRPELPLRQSLICPGCGRKLTGGRVTNKYEYTYWYYWCPNEKCRAVSVRADRVHQEFAELLESLRIDAPLCESFVDSLREKWEAKHGDSATIVARLTRELNEENETKQELLFKHIRGRDTHIEKNFSPTDVYP